MFVFEMLCFVQLYSSIEPPITMDGLVGNTSTLYLYCGSILPWHLKQIHTNHLNKATIMILECYQVC
jgi:hypothetical protein